MADKIEAHASFQRSKNLKGLRKEYRKVYRAMQRLVGKPVEEHSLTAEVGHRRLERLEGRAG